MTFTGKLFGKGIVCLALLALSACATEATSNSNVENSAIMGNSLAEKGYASVNGLKMYYEIHGKGEPLVLIHGGGSTIESNWSKMLPLLAKNYKVIAMELQAHGRTADIDRPLSFEQSADDVAALLQFLKIPKADVVGFSNGGSVTLQLEIRHPELVKKAVVISAMYRRDGLPAQFWSFMKNASIANMPQPLKDSFLHVNPDTKALQKSHDRDVAQMLNFKDWPDKSIKSIQAPTLVMISDKDVILPEHALKMFRLLPHGHLVILPGLHGEALGESVTGKAGSRLPEATAIIIEDFLQST